MEGQGQVYSEVSKKYFLSKKHLGWIFKDEQELAR